MDLLSSHPILSWKVRWNVWFGRRSFRILRLLPWPLMCLTAWTYSNLNHSVSGGQEQLLCLAEEHSCESLQQQWLQVLHSHIPQVPTQRLAKHGTSMELSPVASAANRTDGAWRAQALSNSYKDRFEYTVIRHANHEGYRNRCQLQSHSCH